MLTIW